MLPNKKSSPRYAKIAGGNYVSETQASTFVCRYCGVKQSNSPLAVGIGPLWLVVQQCADCTNIMVSARLTQRGASLGFPWFSHPRAPSRSSIGTHNTDPEVTSAYEEAVKLFSVHIGASGAYARRALEVILDRLGYSEKSLDLAIKSAEAEDNSDKKLPSRILSALGYVREVGNFALHVRRDRELSILEMDSAQVSVCLEVIEELVEFLYEQPARQYNQIVKLNEQLVASGKKALPLPTLLWTPEPEGPAGEA